LLGPLSTLSFLDLLFGRIQLHFYFDGPSFFRLCTNHGVRVVFHKKRTTNTSWPVPKVWRKTRHLTNDGMLKILCLDIEELLGKILIDSLNKYFCHWQRDV